MSTKQHFWNRFWIRRVPPHSLALTRIAVGLYLLLYAGLYVPHIRLLFSNKGTSLPLYLEHFPEFAWALSPAAPGVTYILYALLLISMVGITFGAYFRWSVFVCTLLSLYFWQIQLHIFPTSYNRILLFVLIVFFWSGAATTLSYDVWRKTQSIWSAQPISILPIRLIALQITITFLGVSLQKFWLPHWQSGEILAYSFISRWGTPLGFWWAQLPLTLTWYDITVWCVKILQPLAAVGLWIPRARMASIMFLTGFLLLISTMLSIWWFIFIIPAFILFYPPEAVADFLASYRATSNSKSTTK